MTTKRVDELQPTDRIMYRGEAWRVTRVRCGHTNTSRALRLRPPLDRIAPEDVTWPCDTIVEVVLP